LYSSVWCRDGAEFAAGQGGLMRLAASPLPAAPAAPMSVWASSMKRMIGTGEAFTSWYQP